MKPSIPKGTRDFIPIETARRNYIFSNIRDVFELFGYTQIETPAMENLATLTGKYGDEGDKLIFKILNSGEFASKVDDEDWNSKEAGRIIKQISKKALRYDLTVPFARFVVQHQNDLTFPFKRYQIQPVWRADRPQKGRYQEFFQCDADVIGSSSLLNEYELVLIFDKVFERLNLPVQININNRKILSGLAEITGESEKIVDITVAIDKMDKIGLEGVEKELLDKGVSSAAVEKLKPIITFEGDIDAKMELLSDVFQASTEGQEGVDEMRTLLNFIQKDKLKFSQIQFDISLARGLNYYTGTIFEVKVPDASIGSVCGGGRYDDLTGVFGLKNMSGVGISFGADRIYDLLLEKDLFPRNFKGSTKLMIVNFGQEEQDHCLEIVAKLRAEGINAELYPDQAKMKKQMTYANNKSIPFVLLVGSQEIFDKKYTLKNMESGEQSSLSIEQLTDALK